MAGIRSRLAAALVALVVAGCSSGAVPTVPTGPDGRPDAALEEGRTIYARQCARCHGVEGKGGVGPRLASRMVEAFPDPTDQAELIREGRRGMPAFPDLDEGQLDAVVRYSREVL